MKKIPTIGRIEKLLTYTRQTKYGLSKELGFQNGSVFNNIISGRNGISTRLAKRIINCYPEINYEWLINGMGEMIIADSNKKEGDDIQSDRVEQLESIIKGLDARIQLLENKLKELS